MMWLNVILMSLDNYAHFDLLANWKRQFEVCASNYNQLQELLFPKGSILTLRFINESLANLGTYRRGAKSNDLPFKTYFLVTLNSLWSRLIKKTLSEDSSTPPSSRLVHAARIPDAAGTSFEESIFKELFPSLIWTAVSRLRSRWCHDTGNEFKKSTSISRGWLIPLRREEKLGSLV